MDDRARTVLVTALACFSTYSRSCNLCLEFGVSLLKLDDPCLEAGNKRITYASATNFKTETAGEVETLGTGGAVNYLHTNDRTSATYTAQFGAV